MARGEIFVYLILGQGVHSHYAGLGVTELCDPVRRIQDALMLRHHACHEKKDNEAQGLCNVTA